MYVYANIVSKWKLLINDLMGGGGAVFNVTMFLQHLLLY